jgi:hypothetical protein
VLDCREDMKVGECSDNGEKDNGLYRCVGCMERERTQEGSHCQSSNSYGGRKKENVKKSRREAKRKGLSPVSVRGKRRRKAHGRRTIHNTVFMDSNLNTLAHYPKKEMRPRSPLKSLPPPFISILRTATSRPPHSTTGTASSPCRHPSTSSELPRVFLEHFQLQLQLSASPVHNCTLPYCSLGEYKQRTKAFALYWPATSCQYALSFPSSAHSQ